MRNVPTPSSCHKGEKLSLGEFLSGTLWDLNMIHGHCLVLLLEKYGNLLWQKVLLNFPVKELETSKWMWPIQGLSLSSSDSTSPKPPMAGSWWQISSPALSVCISVAGWRWGRRCLLPCPPVPALPDPWHVELCQTKCALWCICVSQCFGVESLSESLLLFLFHPWACNDRRDETWRNAFTDAKKGIRSPGPSDQGYFCQFWVQAFWNDSLIADMQLEWSCSQGQVLLSKYGDIFAGLILD